MTPPHPVNVHPKTARILTFKNSHHHEHQINIIWLKTKNQKDQLNTQLFINILLRNRVRTNHIVKVTENALDNLW